MYEIADISQEMKGSQLISTVEMGSSAVRKSQFHTSHAEIGSNPVTTNTLDESVSLEDQQFEMSSDYPGFFEIPIIRLMRSAVSLNSRTHFYDFAEMDLADGDFEQGKPARVRPWFLPPYQELRECEILVDKTESQAAMVWLQKGAGDEIHPHRPFSSLGLFLLPVDLGVAESADRVFSNLEIEITNCRDLNGFTRAALSGYLDNRTGTRTLVLLGRNKKEFVSELAHARAGVEKADSERINWQTPAGSFYTPEPLGERGKIAFVYPGAFGTYVGMGREIFYLFPELHNTLEALTENPGGTINELVIFPLDNSPEKWIRRQEELDSSPTRMISSGICFSYLFSTILRDIFKVQPQAAFGYSLGEISMMFAMGIWSQADAMRTSLEVSPVFQERVSGPQNAIREFWGMPAITGEHESRQIWSNMVLLAPLEKVRDAVESEERVYITHINAPRQVVIGGDPDACQRIVAHLKCMHLQTPYYHAIHCPPVMSEFNHFLRLHEWPVEQQPDIPVYSAANYAALDYDSKSIALSFARMLTQPIDFPRLVNLAYRDGAQIFIELGAGSNCSKWVESTLKGKPHASFSINANQVSDHVSILALLARLISHQVPLELDTLIR
jgi:PfaB family protein